MTGPVSQPRRVSPRFNDKLALITGSGRGIGREIALALASHGARLGLLARTRAELEEVAGVIADAGGQALVLVADLSRPDEVAAALDRLRADAGVIDILVNNAGVPWPAGLPAKLDGTQVRTAIAINLAAPIELSLHVLPGMLAQGRGEIVNLSGDVSQAGILPGLSVYLSAKSGLEAFSRSLAAELRDTGIHVNVFRPGAVDTSMLQYILDQPPEEIGPLKDLFAKFKQAEMLTSPAQAAAALLDHLGSGETGQIWDAGTGEPDHAQ